LYAGLDTEEVGHARTVQCHAYRSVFEYISTQLDAEAISNKFPLRRAFSSTGKEVYHSTSSKYSR